MEFIHPALLIPSLCLLFLTLWLLTLKQHRKEGGGDAPGPWNLPFIGSLHHILGSRLPHHTFRDLSAIYGPIMRLKLGEINTVIISSPEAAREVMKTHDIAFATRPISISIATLCYGGNDIIFSPYGEFWRQMRRICTLELFNAKRVQSFRTIREEEVSRLIQSMAKSSGSVVNFSSAMAEVTNDIMARTIIGGRCGDQKLFFSALSEVVELLNGFTVADLFPSLPFLARVFGHHRRLEQCKVRLDQMAERIVKEHKEKMAKQSSVEDDSEAFMKEEDLTDVLLKLQQGGSLPFSLTDDNIKAVINDLLMAGSETTSTLLEWVMSELVQNPNIMKKVQAEVRETLGGINMQGKFIEEAVLRAKLPYLQLVMKEAFRLHIPVPLLLPRENQESIEVMGYKIPAKTTVIINMWAITRDAKYWDDPNIFCPERFEDSSLDFKGTHFEFAPFGAGRRICPGMQLGLATIDIVLPLLLYYFDWEYLGTKLDMTEAFGVATRRLVPLNIVPTLRYPLPF